MTMIPRLSATARRGLLASAVATFVVTTSGCGTAGVTQARVEAAIVPAFADLYALQRHELGYPQVSGSKIPARATCDRGGAMVNKGPGPNWRCVIVWAVAGPGTQATAVYNLTVQPDGCYRAEGESPQAINGQQTMVAFDGTSFLNPLWAFDGCFDNG